MNKSILILKREYLTRIRKRSFIITTLLVPFFFAGILIVPVWLTTRENKQVRNVAVYDESKLFVDRLGDAGYTKYSFIDEKDYNYLKENMQSSGYNAVLYIPADIFSSNSAQLLSDKQIPFELSEEIKGKLSQIIEADKRSKVINETKIPDLEQRLADTRTRIKLTNIKVSETGEEKKSSSFLAFGASYVMGFIIYFFVFMYGSLVMRSVMEEKKNRIVEVIISSVKPFQLMFGKITGTALVGLTQVAIWIVLGAVSMTALQLFFLQDVTHDSVQTMLSSPEQINSVVSSMPDNKVMEVIDMLGTLNLPFIFFSFLFFFLGGYLLYSSLLGALGSAVDNDEDIQQMLFPVTFPLILSIVLLAPIAQNPDGPIAFWASIIPLTSPVAMLARVPYGVPAWEYVLSAVLLVGTTVGAIWAAARIYRTGILMYGKKVNLKEIIKWLRYKN